MVPNSLQFLSPVFFLVLTQLPSDCEVFVETGLVAVFDRRHYLSELGMRRAANMSRVLPGVIRRRYGAYLDRWYREH